MSAIWGECKKPNYQGKWNEYDEVDGDTDHLDGEDEYLIEETEDIMYSMSSIYREASVPKERVKK